MESLRALFALAIAKTRCGPRITRAPNPRYRRAGNRHGTASRVMAERAMAERAGFEPAMGCPIRHFQCRALGL
jgi:hypothetical protein